MSQVLSKACYEDWLTTPIPSAMKETSPETWDMNKGMGHLLNGLTWYIYRLQATDINMSIQYVTGRVLNKLQQWITFACVTMLLVSHGWSISIHKNIFISTMYGYQRTNTHIIFFEAVAKLKLVNHSYITRLKMLHYYVWLIIISQAYKEKLLFIYSQLTKEWGNKKFNSFPIKYNLKYNNSNTWLCWQLNKYQ